jgi:hypothetical protein
LLSLQKSTEVIFVSGQLWQALVEISCECEKNDKIQQEKQEDQELEEDQIKKEERVPQLFTELVEKFETLQ